MLPPMPPPPPSEPTRKQFKAEGLPKSPFAEQFGNPALVGTERAPDIVGPVAEAGAWGEEIDPSRMVEAPGTGEIAMPVASPTKPLPTVQNAPDSRPAEVASWVTESMWNYENRPRGRSAQAHLGPSEIGSECDRKLVFKLKGFTATAHGGGPKWPAIVGTGVHTWMESMSQWLDGERGRFLIEHHVTIIEDELEGTLDLYDRMRKRVIDWKAPSMRAVRKYKIEGVGQQYYIQGQLYALGLAMQGETPKDIAIVMVPRDAASIEQGIHVEVFDYKPSVAREAVDKFKRLRDLALTVGSALEVDSKPSSLCTYCSFYSPGVAGACDGTTRKVMPDDS